MNRQLYLIFFHQIALIVRYGTEGRLHFFREYIFFLKKKKQIRCREIKAESWGRPSAICRRAVSLWFVFVARIRVVLLLAIGFLLFEFCFFLKWFFLCVWGTRARPPATNWWTTRAQEKIKTKRNQNSKRKSARCRPDDVPVGWTAANPLNPAGTKKKMQQQKKKNMNGNNNNNKKNSDFVFKGGKPRLGRGDECFTGFFFYWTWFQNFAVGPIFGTLKISFPMNAPETKRVE